MDVNIFDNYPDYLKEIYTLDLIRKWQKKCVSSYNSSVTLMLHDIHPSHGLNDMWLNMPDVWPRGEEYNALKAAHKRYAELTIDNIKEGLQMWMHSGSFDVDYNVEERTLTIRHKNSVTDLVKQRVRDFLPCNMEVNWEQVKELS